MRNPALDRYGNFIASTVERLRTICSNRTLDLTFGTLFLMFVLGIFVLSIALPGYAYDLVPYLGAVFQANGMDIAETHRNAWLTVQQSTPADSFNDLAHANEYRQRQSSDPAAFHSILPLYSVKAGYIHVLQLLGPWLGWVKSAVWVNHIAGLSVGILALVWMIKGRFLQAAPLVTGVLLASNYFDATRYSGPDTLATVLTLAGVLVWLRNKELMALGLFMLAFLFRPDTLLFVFALTISVAAMGLPKLRTTVSFLVLLLASIAIQQWHGHPGWWTHFYFSNVTIQPSLEGFEPAFTLFSYAKGFARGMFMSLTDFDWPVILMATLFGIAVLARKGFEITKRQTAMLLALFLAIGGKFIVFPLPDDRIYLAFVLAMAMITLEIWKPRLGWKSPSG